VSNISKFGLIFALELLKFRNEAMYLKSTSSSAIADDVERTALQGGLVMAKSGRLELGDNINGHYKSTYIQPL